MTYIIHYILNIHEYNHNYNYIRSNTILTHTTIYTKRIHFIGDPLNFPGTHTNDHLWVLGTHYIQNLSSLPLSSVGEYHRKNVYNQNILDYFSLLIMLEEYEETLSCDPTGQDRITL